MSKLLNGAYITGEGKLNGSDIATTDYVMNQIAALSFDNVVQASELNLADYVSANGTGVTEGTMVVFANGARYIRKDTDDSNVGTTADFIDVGSTVVADGSIDATKLSTTVLDAFSDAVGKVLLVTGDDSTTSFVLTHNAGTKDIIVSVRDVTTDELVMPNIFATSTNTITVTFATAPASGQVYRVMVNRIKYGVTV